MVYLNLFLMKNVEVSLVAKKLINMIYLAQKFFHRILWGFLGNLMDAVDFFFLTTTEIPRIEQRSCKKIHEVLLLSCDVKQDIVP